MSSVRIPESKGSRNTIYIDESGTPSLKSLNKQDFKYFILTGVVGNNFDFERLEAYYYNLKMKYFNKNRLIHSAEFFKNPSPQQQNYIRELALFLDSIPFYSFTVIINKKRVLTKANFVSASNPYSTTLSELKSLWKNSSSPVSFDDLTIRDSMTLIGSHKFKNINMLYPLQLSLRKILEQYTNECVPKMYNTLHPQIEVCFESSPFRKEILSEIEKYTLEKDHTTQRPTQFAQDLEKVLFSISFPNKKAKYMGLEIADIISYGYYLKKRRELHCHPSFLKIWKVIRDKDKEFTKKKSLSTTLDI